MFRAPRQSKRTVGHAASRAAALALALCACSDPAPRTLDLARGFSVEGGDRSAGQHVLVDGSPIRTRIIDGETWVEIDVATDRWRGTLRPGLWALPLAVRGVGTTWDGSASQRLVVDGEEIPVWTPDRDGTCFFTYSTRLFLQLDEDAPRPQRAQLTLYAQHERIEDGERRVSGRRFTASGISVWPGERRELVVDVPQESVLRFATAYEALSPGTSRRPRRVGFTVTLDGTELSRTTLESTEPSAYAWHSVALPPAGREQARLTLTVDGDFAFSSFLTPVIGPALAGDAADGPPSVVVFLADTFRADNLGSYGGAPGFTPALDAWAEESVRFDDYRAVGTWTLPTHSTMFTGLFPGETGAVFRDSALPPELGTIAEHFAAHGYRTGAITDSLVVSKSYGLDQGFQWFDELRDDVESTLARARDFLDADDGRPVFLFVHTYAVHTPYLPSRGARERAASKLGEPVGGDFFTLNDQYRGRGTEPGEDSLPVSEEERARILKELGRLYKACVVDLDTAFARFREDLARRGLLESGYLVFTSDHGESFGEHGQAFHDGIAFEHQIKVPLLIHGPDLEPRVVRSPTSQLDVAPTLAALAGLPPRPEWRGTDLLRLDAERPQLSYGNGILTVIDGGHKVFARRGLQEPGPAVPCFAFDLTNDPHERHDVLGSAPWPAELYERFQGIVDTALFPGELVHRRELDREALRELEAMGYGGQ